MSRKTVEVSYLREKANYFFANSAPEQKEERRGMAALLESALFSSQNYQGYMYLSSEIDPDTQILRDGFDETRRKYLS
jgi:hypothetical protein